MNKRVEKAKIRISNAQEIIEERIKNNYEPISGISYSDIKSEDLVEVDYFKNDKPYNFNVPKKYIHF